MNMSQEDWGWDSSRIKDKNFTEIKQLIQKTPLSWHISYYNLFWEVQIKRMPPLRSFGCLTTWQTTTSSQRVLGRETVCAREGRELELSFPTAPPSTTNPLYPQGETLIQVYKHLNPYLPMVLPYPFLLPLAWDVEVVLKFKGNTKCLCTQ